MYMSAAGSKLLVQYVGINAQCPRHNGEEKDLRRLGNGWAGDLKDPPSYSTSPFSFCSFLISLL
jgi:hypothetical protein